MKLVPWNRDLVAPIRLSTALAVALAALSACAEDDGSDTIPLPPGPARADGGMPSSPNPDSSQDPDAGQVPNPDPGTTPTPSPTPSAGGDCWQLGTIPDFTAMGNAGPGYPAPALSASCTDDELVLSSNGIPTFEFVPITPNDLAAQSYTWHIPRHPSPAAATTDVPLVGAAAVTVTGLPIFGPTEAPMDGSRDPFLDDMLANLLDDCNGHTAPGGMYHFHARPTCLVTSLGGERFGLVIGYALDGYPIVAPVACDDAACASTHRLQSSWRLTLDEYTTATRGAAWEIHEHVEGSGDLDRCNGVAIDDPSSPYDYAYVATDTFPYFMGCYRGTPEPTMMGMTGPPPGR